ncbi:hypothetical protein DQ04_20911000 [Trypanosoma grayi]|uniref:hypothetical protein n=1 Tax=Trypanosoma grayi TaxID=71804 RepID=UPI0004F431CB|nr:hypothetical protein DQ04_20911000 [Trypanosoma grayi]KEG05525.1 hypothetical protein DQ04_20911000 [Trypanosoma grayi]
MQLHRATMPPTVSCQPFRSCCSCCRGRKPSSSLDPCFTDNIDPVRCLPTARTCTAGMKTLRCHHCSSSSSNSSTVNKIRAQIKKITEESNRQTPIKERRYEGVE